MGDASRVLIADDDATFREASAAMLRRQGYDCACAADGIGAARMLQSGQYDVLLADINMRGNRDLALVKTLAHTAAPPAVILVTAFPSLESATISVQLPVAAYLLKPLDFDEMLAAVEDAIAHRRTLETATFELVRNGESFRQVAETLPDAFLVVNGEGAISYVNHRTTEMFGYRLSELQGQPVEILVPEAQRDVHHARRNDYISSPHARPMDARMNISGRRKNGSEFPAEVALNPLRTADGRYVTCIIRDVSERQRYENALRGSERRFRDYADTAADWFWEMNSELKVSYVSARREEITGQSPREMLGQTMEEIYGRTVHDPEAWRRYLDNLAMHRLFRDVEIHWPRSDGVKKILLLSGKPLFAADGEFQGYRGVGRDVTEAHDLATRLSYQASHDVLTGLVNRREFERQLQRMLATARDSDIEHALCYLDLDQFKLVNDTCGHAAGDELLRQIGERMLETVSKNDVLARLGGDEFGLLMARCSLTDARGVANELRSAVAAFRFVYEGKTFKTGVSIGLVPIRGDITTVAGLLSAADSACFMAKDRGRNRIYVSECGDTEVEHRQSDMLWITRINSALEEDRLRLFAQRIVAIAPRPSTPFSKYFLKSNA